MKKIENNYAVTGFVAKDAEVRQFTTTSVARFPLAGGREEHLARKRIGCLGLKRQERYTVYTTMYAA